MARAVWFYKYWKINATTLFLTGVVENVKLCFCCPATQCAWEFLYCSVYFLAYVHLSPSKPTGFILIWVVAIADLTGFVQTHAEPYQLSWAMFWCLHVLWRKTGLPPRNLLSLYVLLSMCHSWEFWARPLSHGRPGGGKNRELTTLQLPTKSP